jgi:hypothetical protein
MMPLRVSLQFSNPQGQNIEWWFPVTKERKQWEAIAYRGGVSFCQDAKSY